MNVSSNATFILLPNVLLILPYDGFIVIEINKILVLFVENICIFLANYDMIKFEKRY